MTEAEWLTHDDPVRMLRFLRHRMSRRKLRLFIGEAYLPINQAWAPLTPDELAALPDELDLWSRGLLRYEILHPTSSLGSLLANMAESLGGYFDFARLIWDEDWLDAHRLSKRATEDAARFANLLRDLLGPLPFRDIAVPPAWLTSDVLALARGIYDEKAFDRMPILADALQDAGCDNDEVLSHCRTANREHVRGCWVVDLLLGKAWREA